MVEDGGWIGRRAGERKLTGEFKAASRWRGRRGEATSLIHQSNKDFKKDDHRLQVERYSFSKNKADELYQSPAGRLVGATNLLLAQGPPLATVFRIIFLFLFRFYARH
jgi:hypothetical protein